MRFLCLFFLLPLSIISNANEDSLLRVRKETFLKTEFSKIELVTIEPECKSMKEKIEGKFFKKKIISCTQTSVIYHNPDTNSRLINKNILEKEDYQTLLNIFYRDTINGGNNMSCYEPRHGVLFYDETGKYCGFIEICFYCYSIRVTHEIPSYSQLGIREFELLRNLFHKYRFEVNDQHYEK